MAHCALRVRLSSCSHHVLPSLADPLRQFLLTPADDTVHRRSSAERSIWEFLSHTQERPGTDPEALETVWMPGSAPRPPGEGVTTRTPAPGRRDRAEARPSLTALARPTSTLLPSEAGSSHDPTSCRGWRGGICTWRADAKGRAAWMMLVKPRVWWPLTARCAFYARRKDTPGGPKPAPPVARGTLGPDPPAQHPGGMTGKLGADPARPTAGTESRVFTAVAGAGGGSLQTEQGGVAENFTHEYRCPQGGHQPAAPS